MKKTILGIGFLVLAGWVLLQGNFGIPMFNFNIWPLLLVGMFAYFGTRFWDWFHHGDYCSDDC